MTEIDVGTFIEFSLENGLIVPLDRRNDLSVKLLTSL